ncbi:MAG: OsmC family peroxiredoxin [Euryarchaeota archaeon]|nr:OsmC family peroxiredoxin [Euryarchaeota archaeon]MDE1835359.1 OsmC family peroxiredoxin [Euryarchaeota archaeon]MDE1880462.1 OsmC family peroxiredoxin [Euryarchaeota archaeon]MDE2043655.1 OsmC family peroxiredoxin [Thermoplasmata archaeon]
MPVTRKARATWRGDLVGGKGTVRTESSALAESPITWKARSEEPGGMTSPEELLAAAHAACFAMALSHGLAKGGTPAKEVRTSASATFEKVGDGFKVTRIELDVVARVPGADPKKFEELARTTGESGCPISKALAGNVAISVMARLE